MTGEDAIAPDMMRWAAKQWWRARRPWLRRRLHRTDTVTVAGLTITVAPGVHHPVVFRSGRLFAEYLATAHRVTPGMRVLDVGTGTGVLALTAALAGAEVTAVDINPAATRCARANVRANGLDGLVDVREGDLFTPVAGETFDLVVCNPPFFRGTPGSMADAAWRSPDLIERFTTGVPPTLADGGGALVVMSSDGDESGMLAACSRALLRVSTVWQRDLLNEIMTIYHLRPVR